MIRNYLFFLLLLFGSCKAQSVLSTDLVYTSDLIDFRQLSALREILDGVEIIALGENTHGLGQVFKTKVDLVKFLHQKMGFDLILFESGFGDGALAWHQLDGLTPEEYTRTFTSNFYYHCQEMVELMSYVKSHRNTLEVQGFDCQPQQHYLIKRMAQVVAPIDTALSKAVSVEFQNFNLLYQYENDDDSTGFYKQRAAFVSFLSKYDKVINDYEKQILKSGVSSEDIIAIRQSNHILLSTYANVNFGSMMGWPMAANVRDKSMYETIKWYKAKHADAKIIIWAQNSHIEKMPKVDDNVQWMGHSLKATYGHKYYAMGTIVYSGKNLDYQRTWDFEHNDKDYLAYHLNRYPRNAYILDVRHYSKDDFINQALLDMESGGNTARSIAKERWDGILFIKHSGIPQLLTNK